MPAPAHRWARVLTHLQTTLEVDVVVHQAVGMVAAAQEVDIATAAAALAAHAQRLGTEVTDAARQVVARTLPAGTSAPPGRPGTAHPWARA
ncbi:ANTAR domain-containing protein [Rhodococcus antarcticus]|jgi:CYTH domain-containing protein|uniref:ANTAR domain-containing protein n=1 Tax=Rhodococcus antarcticus TaxID=2987751 RepID=A0ABY6P479_9NOCA|nr:ANTAR domain-containing protein [Rhodococcus antarcticus]UZJ25883.1 ANTAR domain-containing protein [Rhodococcus antarcticus]